MLGYVRFDIANLQRFGVKYSGGQRAVHVGLHEHIGEVFQLAGAAVAIVWAGGVSFIVYRFIQRFIGLRIAPSAELGGASLEVNEDMDPVQRLRAKVRAHTAAQTGE